MHNLFSFTQCPVLDKHCPHGSQPIKWDSVNISQKGKKCMLNTWLQKSKMGRFGCGWKNPKIALFKSVLNQGSQVLHKF